MTSRTALGVVVLAIVCGLVAITATAQTGEVYSLNVVGFQKVTAVAPTQGGLVLASTPFYQNIPNIDNVVGTGGVAGTTLATADNVLMYDKFAQTYRQYWLLSHGSPAYNRHWTSASGLATNVYILPGVGYWHRNRATQDVTVVLAGDVVDDAAITNLIVPGLQMLSYPFSTAIRLTEMTFTNGVAGTTLATADNIMTYQPTNQQFAQYWLLSHANSNFNRKWVSAAGLATNVFIQPGQGFWFRSRLTTTNLWVEARPYTL